MKYIILIGLFLGSLGTAMAQQTKQLPDTIRLKLTKQQYINLISHVDSAENALQTTSTAPASEVTKFNQRVSSSLYPLLLQVQGELVEEKKPEAGKKGGKL